VSPDPVAAARIAVGVRPPSAAALSGERFAAATLRLTAGAAHHRHPHPHQDGGAGAATPGAATTGEGGVGGRLSVDGAGSRRASTKAESRHASTDAESRRTSPVDGDGQAVARASSRPASTVDSLAQRGGGAHAAGDAHRRGNAN